MIEQDFQIHLNKQILSQFTKKIPDMKRKLQTCKYLIQLIQNL